MSTYLLTYWTLFDHLVDYNSTSLIRSCPSCKGKLPSSVREFNLRLRRLPLMDDDRRGSDAAYWNIELFLTPATTIVFIFVSTFTGTNSHPYVMVSHMESIPSQNDLQPRLQRRCKRRCWLLFTWRCFHSYVQFDTPMISWSKYNIRWTGNLWFPGPRSIHQFRNSLEDTTLHCLSRDAGIVQYLAR